MFTNFGWWWYFKVHSHCAWLQWTVPEFDCPPQPTPPLVCIHTWLKSKSTYAHLYHQLCQLDLSNPCMVWAHTEANCTRLQVNYVWDHLFQVVLGTTSLTNPGLMKTGTLLAKEMYLQPLSYAAVSVCMPTNDFYTNTVLAEILLWKCNSQYNLASIH